MNYTLIKHSVFLISILLLIVILSFSLERSELNSVKRVELSGGNYLSEENYLKFAQLEDIEKLGDLGISVIRDRIEKHPYVEKADVVIENRGVIKIDIYEKSFDAILFSKNKQFLITDKAEVLPLIKSTHNIDLPVIVNNSKMGNVVLFSSVLKNELIYCALKVITAAKLYDTELYDNISEISFDNDNNIVLRLINIDLPIYINQDEEIEKTIYLSKIFRHMKGKQLNQYLDYIDLRYNDLVYLGFEESLINEKGKI